MSSVATLDILIVAQHCALKAILFAQTSPTEMRNQFAYAAAYAAYAAAVEAKMGGEGATEMVLLLARSAADYAQSAGVAYDDLIGQASRIGWVGNVAPPTTR